MKTKKEILDHLKKYPGAKVKFAVTDIDGILRGKIISLEKFMALAGDGSGFCDVVFGWDSGDVLYDNASYTGWHTGYPDAHAKADINTFRTLPWEENIPFFLGDFTGKDGKSLNVCPRSLLKKIAGQAEKLGYYPVFSEEFEWFNFRETPQSLHEKDYRNPEPLSPGMFGYSILRPSLNQNFFHELFNHLTAAGIPIEGLHTETGPGVYEAAIQYSDIVEAADRAVLFKTWVKELAYRHGIMASFMAKWNEKLPGCGGHIHQSLWSRDQKSNLFYDSKAKNTISEVMKSYIAGQLHCLPHILPMYAPTINSFKRLVEGAWAPTTLTWGIDNRTTTLRALPGSAKSTRLETRVPGADVNPYLAMAAALASGLYGVKNKMKLKVEAIKGNGYLEKGNGVLPGTLEKATHAMKNSSLAKELFGDEFVDHFVSTREWEIKQYAKAVTDWELRRYFEII
ncbi:MAG: glutamine synthetase family protein [Cytophagaceae bacterium]